MMKAETGVLIHVPLPDRHFQNGVENMALTNPTKSCPIPQCTKMQAARGLCHGHYKKRESLGMPKYLYGDLASRFWPKVKKGAPDDCWPWIAAHDQRGYGKLGWKGENKRATHVSLFLLHGAWPTQDVLHSCDNPPCVNPAHLREGTHLENMREAIERGRFGEQQGRNFAKLTGEQAAEIRRRSTDGDALSALAVEFNVSLQTVWRIREGLTWNQTLRTTPNKIRQIKRLGTTERGELKQRALAGERLADLATEYGVGYVTAWKIREGRRG
jgi:hypothetical protein